MGGWPTQIFSAISHILHSFEKYSFSFGLPMRTYHNPICAYLKQPGKDSGVAVMCDFTKEPLHSRLLTVTKYIEILVMSILSEASYSQQVISN